MQSLIQSLESEVAAAARAKAEAEEAARGHRAAPTADEAARRLADTSRIAPAVHFADARGPARLAGVGQKMLGFGEPDGFGGTVAGAVARRPARARRFSRPADGWVVYAGPFRSYGQVLILNAGDGYHIVLAGMERIDAALGQFVLAGEPVAVMGATQAREHRRNRPHFCPAHSLCRISQGWQCHRFSALVGARRKTARSTDDA